MTKLLKEVLGDKVEKVIVSDTLVDSPCVLITLAYGCFCEHGAQYVSEGAERQLDDFLHGVQEDDGGQSHALRYDGIERKSVGRQSDKTVKDLI